MKALGKFFGFWLCLIGLLVLIPAIIAVGTVRTAISAEYLSDIPREVIKQLPSLADETFKAAQEPGAMTDPNSKMWVDALAKAKLKPSELLKKLGIDDWLKNQLDVVLKGIGDLMRGKGKATDIVLDNRPLKKALTGEAFRSYLQSVLVNLPACDPLAVQDWQNAINAGDSKKPLKACNPGPQAVTMIVSRVSTSMSELPDQKVIVKKEDFPPTYGVNKFASSLIWLVFLLPFVLIAFGAVMGGTGGRGILRWMGVPLLFGGAIPLFGAWAMKSVALGWIKLDPSYWKVGAQTPYWTEKADKIVIAKATALIERAATPLFSSTFTVALIVTLVGLGFIIISFFAGSGESAAPHVVVRK